jgi:hypothetical protein
MAATDLAMLSMAPLLQRIAAELLHCQAILARIEHSVHAALQVPTPVSPPITWQSNLQDIDLLEQNLGDLAMCLSAIAGEPLLRATADLSAAKVLGPLRLNDLRQRLHGKPAAAECCGPVEIF